MHVTRRPRAARALLALACSLALLGPGAAGRATAAADATGSLVAVPAAGPEQGLLRDRPGHTLVAAAGKRDDRERPGPALPGLLVTAVAAASAVATGRWAGRFAGRLAAAAGARAPPSLQPAPI